ncbi:hypothetical protein [Sediminicola luteus]|uniref:Glycine dehydrogenase n=1 Tax=Sediminicola luteus TaxID=319238 RepID=A0A2A4G7F6_9FLAO|nr:hypothetical protein [Sediminicola luteus]PCE64567.1 hypothetical protein B7P33_09820 [Sediminicola luteus]
MISCEEAAEICDKAQYDEVSKWRYLKLRIHLLFCKTCAQHSKKNTQLSHLCQKAELHSLTESEKEEMKTELEKKTLVGKS